MPNTSGATPKKIGFATPVHRERKSDWQGAPKTGGRRVAEQNLHFPQWLGIDRLTMPVRVSDSTFLLGKRLNVFGQSLRKMVHSRIGRNVASIIDPHAWASYLRRRFCRMRGQDPRSETSKTMVNRPPDHLSETAP